MFPHSTLDRSFTMNRAMRLNHLSGSARPSIDGCKGPRLESGFVPPRR
jgi:hypothetical protein